MASFAIRSLDPFWGLTSSGVDASFLNQPIEVPDIRARLNDSVAPARYCQAILRLGHAKPVPATPRRPDLEFLEPIGRP
jgi:hypothetical protein